MMKKLEHIQKIANLMCDKESKPLLCINCSDKKNCFSINKAETLYEAGCRLSDPNIVTLTRLELTSKEKTAYEQGYEAGRKFQRWQDIKEK
jgi:hypothetical protein